MTKSEHFSVRKRTSLTLILLSAVFLCVTTFGWVYPNDQRTSLDVDLGYQLALDKIDAAFADHGASYRFISMATSTYAQAISYSWLTDLTRISFTDNWILHFLGYIDWVFVKLGFTTVPNLFSEFLSLDYRRGFQRGYGICSQNAVAFVDLLDKRYQIEARVVGLDGHVVLEAILDKKTTHDPSVGLSFPFEVQNATANIEDLSRQYQAVGYGEYVSLFDPAGNVYEPHGAQGYQPKIYWIERLSDHLKWWLPVAGLFFGALMRRTKPVD